MATYFYTDTTGQKHGPVDDSHLRELVAKGVVMPDTPLETDTGYKGDAGQISELVFTVIIPTSPANPFSAEPPEVSADSCLAKRPMPIAAWIVFALGIVGMMLSWTTIYLDKTKFLGDYTYTSPFTVHELAVMGLLTVSILVIPISLCAALFSSAKE